MIGVEQWYKINDTVTALFNAEDLPEIQRILMDGIWSLVPYDQAMFYMIREYKGLLRLSSPYSVNVSSAFAEEYEERRFGKNIMADAFLPLTIVLRIGRDCDGLIPPTMNGNGLIPPGMEQGVRALIAGKRRAAAEVTLFRAKAGGPFTENELEILRVLARHLEACMKRDPLYAYEREQNHELQLRQQLRYMALTEAEIEIVLLVAAGMTNEQIAELKQIALTTVKKHLSRVYNKMGVPGRVQLQYEIYRMRRDL